jgi:hypothetical protein
MFIIDPFRLNVGACTVIMGVGLQQQQQQQQQQHHSRSQVEVNS